MEGTANKPHTLGHVTSEPSTMVLALNWAKMKK